MAINANAETVFSAENLHSCAASCIAKICALSDTKCVCHEYEPAIDHNVVAECSPQDALYARVFVETVCQTPVRDRAITFNLMILVFGSITATIVIVRLVYKQYFSMKRRLEMQDWAILFAAIVGIPCIGFTTGGLTAHGLGKDIWGLDQAELRAFSIYFYVIQVLYVMLITLIKLSLCFFYLNIFAARVTRWILWATVIFLSGAAIAFIIGIIFQCTPVVYAWEKYNFALESRLEGRCININAAGWANAAINVASDFWLLGIPIYEIKSLDLHWKRKIGVSLMFLTGACVTVISFLRLRSISLYARTSNPTWDQWDLVWWSTVEVLVGFICTSLPTIRLLLVHIAPQTFGSDLHADRPAQQYLHRLSSPPQELLDQPPSAKSMNNGHLIIDSERHEIRTAPLGKPGFCRLGRARRQSVREDLDDDDDDDDGQSKCETDKV